MKVYFSHGKESGPRGSKMTQLIDVASQLGYTVDSIDSSDLLDPKLSVERIEILFAQCLRTVAEP